jgi:lysophospholipase L1-like esterase
MLVKTFRCAARLPGGLPLALGAALALATTTRASGEPGVQTFDLSPGSAEIARPYTPGGHGFEPGSTADHRLFSVAEGEGVYRVTVELGGAQAGLTTVKAEGRRLMLRNVQTAPGGRVTRSFLVDVRSPALPAPPTDTAGFDRVRLPPADLAERGWDDRLTLEFSGRPAVRKVTIEPVAAPRLFLVGDSTVADQAHEPYASWGQMLTAMLDDRVAVANHAKSGGTMKFFLATQRLDKVLSQVRPGDWLFIQFAHNDQKREWPHTYVSADGTYPAYLAAFAAEARARGAVPVFVTSPERRNFGPDGRIKDTLGAYAAAMRALAARERVPLIDLNADSVAIYEALGPQRAPAAFAMNGEDHTHHDNYGAWLMASAVAERIRRTLPDLAPHVTAPPFDPHHPPTAEEVAIVPSALATAEKPQGN